MFEQVFDNRLGVEGSTLVYMDTGQYNVVKRHDQEQSTGVVNVTDAEISAGPHVLRQTHHT